MIKEESWYVYILLCAKGLLYTGIAKDPHKRFLQHQKGQGAKFTKMYPPLDLVYQEKVEGHSMALKREIEIKKMSRMQKIMLIQKK